MRVRETEKCAGKIMHPVALLIPYMIAGIIAVCSLSCGAFAAVNGEEFSRIIVPIIIFILKAERIACIIFGINFLIICILRAIIARNTSP